MRASMDFQTPDWVCARMIDMIDGHPKSVLEPTPGEGNLVRALMDTFPNTDIYAPVNIYEYTPPRIFDAIVMNPPFSPMQKGYEILQMVSEWSDQVIALLPWLLLINSEERMQWFVDRGLAEILHLPRRAFSGSRVQTCVVKLLEGYDGDILFQTIREDE